ncbi:MAG: NADH-quinone oxidoreductase subunit H [Thermoleophilia bacterium]|nr:NADH-quinone oxidoreductase subunit H [Thermoleophilia bacterium]
MTGTAAVLGALSVLALAAGPGLAGLVQTAKARLQGRRGADPLQPYRDLRRLWRRSVVDPEGTGAAYRTAPAVIAAVTAAAVLMVPLGADAPRWPFLGADALLVVGLLATARMAGAVSAWDTSAAFGMMGAARDLAYAVSGEALLLGTLLVAALPAGTTDLRGLWAAAAQAETWRTPAHWAGLLAVALVVLVETGRQPIDNPDTHLELTMIHEGPLLEYAGRDLAMLTWVAGARHWIVMGLAAGVFLPHPSGAAAGAVVTVAWLPVLAAATALAESSQAKMRLGRAPRLLASGAVLTLLGAVAWAFGAGL